MLTIDDKPKMRALFAAIRIDDGGTSIATRIVKDIHDDCRYLREAVRHLAIVQRHRLVSGGGSRHVGWHCKMCDGSWDIPPEQSIIVEAHNGDCLAAQSFNSRTAPA